MSIQTMEQLLLQMQNRLNALESAQTVDYGPSVNAATEMFTGVISPYWSSGKAPVTLDQGQSESGQVYAYLPPNSPEIQPGSAVLLTQIASGVWYIVRPYGYPQFLPQVGIQPQNNWILYADVMNADPTGTFGDASNNGTSIAAGSGYTGKIYATMNQYGIVTVCGLLAGGSQTQGSIIGTLPPGWAPAREQWFLTTGSAAQDSVVVQTNGNIVYYGGGLSFFALDNIRFRSAASVAAGLATFTPFTLASPFTEATSTILPSGTSGVGSHTPGWTIDAEGVILFEGCMYTPSATAANAAFAAAVAAFGTANATHQAVMSTTGMSFGRVAGSGGTTAGNVPQFGNAQSATATISIANMMIAPNPVGWQWLAPQLLNSWTNYGSPWETAAIGKTPSGMVYTRGLLATSGTVVSTQMILSKGWRPRYESILAGVSNGALSRTDPNAAISSGINHFGNFAVVGGSGAWYSWGGLGWPAFN